jgi:uncharacterized membrane protein YiaA
MKYWDTVLAGFLLVVTVVIFLVAIWSGDARWTGTGFVFFVCTALFALISLRHTDSL